MAEAMKYAVEKINNDSNYLYGYKLAVENIYDTNSDKVVRMLVFDTFMSNTTFLIGPYSSETSYVTSILTGTLGQLAISYSATYSDFELSDIPQNNMLRTVPSDTYRVQATIDLIQKLKWNYIAVISSYGFNGERDARHFISKLTDIGVCLADQIYLPKHATKAALKAIVSLNYDDRLKAVVLFTTNDDSSLLLSTIKQQNLTNRFYLVCIFGCTNYLEVIEGNEQAATGTISIDMHAYEIPEFKEYFLKQNPIVNTNQYFKTFWEHIFKCSLNKSTNPKYSDCIRKRLTPGNGYYELTPIQTVINAIESAARVLRKFISTVCRDDQYWMENKTACIFNAHNVKINSRVVFAALVKMSFKDGTLKLRNKIRYDFHYFQSIEGTPKNALIGFWEVYRNISSSKYLRLEETFKQFNRHKNRAMCSEECKRSQVRVRDKNAKKAQCCWKCTECPENSIVKNDTCIRCKDIEMPDETTTSCETLPKRFIELENNPLSAVILGLSAVGLGLVSFVVILFIRYNSNRMVRASGRDSSYMILFGICLTFACPFAYMSKPSVLTCVLRGTLPGLSFVVCYAPLFLKTNRIYRIFMHAQTSVSIPSLVSPQSQFLVSFGIASVQILLASVWFASKMPAPDYVHSEMKQYITIHCRGDSSPILMLLNLVLSVLFMLFCTVLAFRTRHFPKNYNEAKFIGITLYITCVAWAVFLPAYFMTGGMGDFWREYLMCGICIAVGYITLLGLFGQKVKILLCPKPSSKSDNNSQMLPYNLSDDVSPASQKSQRTEEESL